MLLICVFCNSLFTILVPVAANQLVALYFLRFLTGLVSAANLPIVNVLVGKWVVYEEKSMWVGIIYAGTSLGTVISILTSGWIMNYLGWEMVFYIHGVLPLLWCVAFAAFFADNPETQKYITEEERQLLVNTYGHRSPGSTDVSVPWKAIFTSGPFLALVATNTLGNFCWYFLLTQMPLYMSKMLKFNIKTVRAIFRLFVYLFRDEVCYIIHLKICLTECHDYLSPIPNQRLHQLSYWQRVGFRPKEGMVVANWRS